LDRRWCPDGAFRFNTLLSFLPKLQVKLFLLHSFVTLGFFSGDLRKFIELLDTKTDFGWLINLDLVLLIE